MVAERLSIKFAKARAFASFFTNYMGLWCVVVAMLPVPVTRLGLIPVYESQRAILPSVATFFCFLALAYVFNVRHGLARSMFAPGLLWPDADPRAGAAKIAPITGPLASMIVGALAFASIYLWAFEVGRSSASFPQLPHDAAHAVVLALSYVGTFLLAEGAFAMMAVREYLQDVLRLTDAEVITGVPRQSDECQRAQAAGYLPAGSSARDAGITAFESEIGH